MNTKLPVRPKFDTRLSIVIAEDEKRELFAVAAKRSTTVSELVRRAIRQVANSPTAA